ncbi:ABC transporter substrate-binding protein [Amorphus sp. 3PC139-8]|uniref:ABC transporter substrate-binding protein n=1 Tax=Amorphus sp. 3PC139-8 TaxID=2735676 RepID=UPI00345D4A83
MRLVTLNLLLTELVLTLELTPQAIANIPLYRRLVAEPDLPSSVRDVGSLQEPNLEYLRILSPDLILAADWQAATQANLSLAGPVQTFPTFPGRTPAIEHATAILLAIAELVGRESLAHGVAEACGEVLRETRARLAAFSLPPIYVCRFMEDGRHMALFGGRGLVGDVLFRTGLVNAWQGSVNGSGVTSSPLRRLADVPEAAIVHFDRGTETERAMQRLSDNPVWTALPAVRAGRVVRLPVVYPNGGLRTAMRFAALLGDRLSELAPNDG